MLKFLILTTLISFSNTVKVKEVDFDPAVEDSQKTISPKVTPIQPQQGMTLEDLKDQDNDGSNDVRSCLIELNDNIYNFQGLQLKDDQYKIHTLGTKAQPHNYTLFFNICEFTTHRCSDIKTMDYANSVNTNQTCEHLSGADATSIKAYLQDENYPDYGVNIKLTHGNACTERKNYGLDIQLNCDAGASKTTFELDLKSISTDQCVPKIIMSSPHGCPAFGLPPLWKWTDQNHWLICAVLIVVGTTFLTVGGRYYLGTMAFVSTFGMSCLMLTFLYGFVLPHTTPQWLVWLSISMSICVGMGLGYGAYNWPKIGVFTIGAVVGSLIGSLFYVVIFFQSDVPTATAAEASNVKNGEMTAADVYAQEQAQLLSCVLSMAGLFGFLSLAFFDYTVIYGSSFFGSYLLVRGFSMIFGGYPNEFLIFYALENRAFLQQDFYLFAYVVAMLFISVASVQHQLQQRLLHLEIYSYKKYDFRYRKADQQPQGFHANENQDPLYDALTQGNDEEEFAEDDGN